MLRKMLIGAIAIVALAAVPASAQYPYNVSPGELSPGGTVSVAGQGCGAGEPVSIYLKRTGPVMLRAQAGEHGDLVAEVTAGADGNFNATFDVPADAEPGVYSVTSVCGSTVQTANVTVDVAPSTTTPGTTPGGSGGGSGGGLSVTGSNLNGFGLAGAGILVLGGAFMIVARRRRDTATA